MLASYDTASESRGRNCSVGPAALSLSGIQPGTGLQLSARPALEVPGGGGGGGGVKLRWRGVAEIDGK